MEAPLLKKQYLEVVVPDFLKDGGYKNVHQVPVVQKIVINSGFNASRDKNWISDLQKEISAVAGQRALITKAKKSVSNFKLREGMPVGCSVTLRGNRMYDFLFRLVGVALPNIRDFRGVTAKLDGRGNFTLGITDHTIFPEINSDTQGKEAIGMDVTIVTSADNDEAGRELLAKLGMPFRKRTPDASAQSAA